MIIIGVDFHPEFQQIASVDTDTGEFQEKRLTHREEAEKIYRALACAGQFAAGRSFPADLGAELGESGSAATAVAPAPHGAGPHAHHEPVASGGPERRPAL